MGIPRPHFGGVFIVQRKETIVATSDKFKNKRAEVAPRREESNEERVAALDNLFASLGTSPPPGAKAPAGIVRQPVNNSSSPGTKSSPGAQVEIYSNFGGGTILINGVNERLPYRVPDTQTLVQLKNTFEIDTAHAILRTRRI